MRYLLIVLASGAFVAWAALILMDGGVIGH